MENDMITVTVMYPSTSGDAFQAAFAQHNAETLADIPNYTNAQPTIQISQVKL
jgi:hypothetical protein